MNAGQALAAEIAHAHGRRGGRLPPDKVTVRFRSGGLAFASKGQGKTLGDVTGQLTAATQALCLAGGHPRPWEYHAAGSADLSAQLASLHRPRRLLRWSVPDVAAFAAAAMWTYLFLPFLVPDAGYDLEELRPRHDRRRLRVRFPAEVATHSPVQILHVDSDGLLRRHDYTALAFGRWARAAQTLDGYRSFDGRLVATRRRVTPRVAGQPAPTPTLVWIEIDDIRWDDDRPDRTPAKPTGRRKPR